MKNHVLAGVEICWVRAASTVALMSIVFTHASSAQDVSFEGLSVGTVVTTQMVTKGIEFLPQYGVLPEIISSPAGNLAGLTQSGSNEFSASAGHGVLTHSQNVIRMHVGLIPGTIAVQANVRLTALDASGNVVSSVTRVLVAGNGFSTELAAGSWSPNIVAFIIEALDDPGHNARIGILDIGWSNLSGQDQADFILTGPMGVNVVAGGPPIDIPIVAHRMGGSTGDINFAASNVADKVSASFRRSSDGVTVRLVAPINASPSVHTSVITGSPSSLAVGPAARSFNLPISVVDGLTISGSSFVDIASCQISGGAYGVMVVPISVRRDATVTGPIILSLGTLPPEVKATITPGTLAFAGGALNESAMVNLTVTAGVAVNFPLNIETTFGSQKQSVQIFVAGICPRTNKNFVIRGNFSCMSVYSHVTPLANARVEFFRYRWWGQDDLVGNTETDENGDYEQALWANIQGDYYARLRLDNRSVDVKDNWALSAWSIDSPHRNNSGPLIDLGSFTIQKDNGWGTPKCAIWQGARAAYVEFEKTTGYEPPSAYSIIVWKGFLTPFSYLATTNWADNYPTGGFGARQNDVALHDFQTSFHEFGHTLRHSYDGDWNHFVNDASLYTYAREHGHCSPGGPGYQANDGFAFNEGWAEYWSEDTAPCDNAPTNTGIEGTVAHDLAVLAQQCPQVYGGDATPVADRPARRREGMISVLRRGQNIIHSDGEFRHQFQLQFPSPECGNLPPVGFEGSAATTNLAGLGNSMYSIGKLQRTLADLLQQSSSNDRTSPSTLQANRVASLRLDILAQTEVTKGLQNDLESAIDRAKSSTDCPPEPCSVVGERLMKPVILRGEIKRSDLLRLQLESELSALLSGERNLPQFSWAIDFERRKEAQSFERDSRAVVSTALREGIAVLTPLAHRDTSGSIAAIVSQLDVQAKQMRSPNNDTYLTFLPLPRSSRDDQLVARGSIRPPFSPSRTGILLAIAAVLVLGALGFAWTRRLSSSR